MGNKDLRHLVVIESSCQQLLLRIVESELGGSSPGAGQGVQGATPDPLPTGATCHPGHDQVAPPGTEQQGGFHVNGAPLVHPPVLIGELPEQV